MPATSTDTRAAQPMTPEELRAQVAAVPFWWHTFDLGHGVVTPGHDDSAGKLRRLAMPADLRGKTVLDIGAWDGFFAFEAERRGAVRVVAMDLWDRRRGGEEPTGFRVARRALGSRVEDLRLGVDDLSRERVGVFDMVLFLGVLYHVEDPLGALRNVAAVTRDLLILETEVDLLWVRRPCLAFYPGAELRGDPTNWFAPNVAGLRAMLGAVGFDSVRLVWKTPRVQRVGRAVRHALAGEGSPLTWMQRARVVVHARREGRAERGAS